MDSVTGGSRRVSSRPVCVSMRRVLIVLVWYFLLLSGDGNQVVGPFGRSEECIALRQTVIEKASSGGGSGSVWASTCWED
jgi:hypothetical protein